MKDKDILLIILSYSKEKLENTKIKEEQHALGYINEAIKWVKEL